MPLPGFLLPLLLSGGGGFLGQLGLGSLLRSGAIRSIPHIGSALARMLGTAIPGTKLTRLLTGSTVSEAVGGTAGGLLPLVALDALTPDEERGDEHSFSLLQQQLGLSVPDDNKLQFQELLQRQQVGPQVLDENKLQFLQLLQQQDEQGTLPAVLEDAGIDLSQLGLT